MTEIAPNPLRDYRKLKNWSLDKAASELPLSKASLSRIENGLQKPSPPLARALSDATGIPAKEFRPDLAEFLRDGD
jgi:transcriptional regulator with XRE-family HTH domain